MSKLPKVQKFRVIKLYLKQGHIFHVSSLQKNPGELQLLPAEKAFSNVVIDMIYANVEENYLKRSTPNKNPVESIWSFTVLLPYFLAGSRRIHFSMVKKKTVLIHMIIKLP